jgi:hypothetical protein
LRRSTTETSERFPGSLNYLTRLHPLGWHAVSICQSDLYELRNAPGGTSSNTQAAFEPAINGSKGRYAKPGYTTGAADNSETGFIYLLVTDQ